MRFKVLTAGACVVLGLVALSSGVARAQTGAAGGKIQYSAPSNPTIASNLNQLNPRPNNFKQVEDDLFKAFKSPESYRPDIITPPPPQFAPPIMDKRTQEMLDQQRNWAFTDINDLYRQLSGIPTEHDPLGRNDRPASVIERYMDNMSNKQQSTTNKVNIASWFVESLSGTNTPGKVLESMTVEGQMIKMMKEAIVPRHFGEGDSDVIDFKHASLKQLSPEQIAEEKRREEAFQQILDPHAAMPALSPTLGGQTGGANLPGLLGQSDPGVNAPRHRSLVAPAGVVDRASKAFYSHAYDDPTALALGQTNNLLTPKPAPTPLTPPLLGPFDPAPKRKF